MFALSRVTVYPDTVTGVLIWLFLICNDFLVRVILPTGRLSLACHASCGGSQPWGPATTHQSSPKRTADGVCASITRPSTNRLCKTNSRFLALTHYWRDWARLRFLQSWTSHMVTTRLRWKRRLFRKQLFALTVATLSFSSCHLG